MVSNNIVNLGGYNPSKEYNLPPGCDLKETGLVRKRTQIDCQNEFEMRKEKAEFCENDPEHPVCDIDLS